MTTINVVTYFITGLCFGIEFPGDGCYFVLHLGIVRLMLVSDEYMKDVE